MVGKGRRRQIKNGKENHRKLNMRKIKGSHRMFVSTSKIKTVASALSKMFSGSVPWNPIKHATVVEVNGSKNTCLA